jgi:hypothetical protein
MDESAHEGRGGAEAATPTLRVDARGIAEPQNEAAKSAMRAMRGALEVLPSPGNVLLLRRLADGRGQVQPTPPLRLCGEIVSPGALCDVLAIAAHARWAGELMVIAESDRGPRTRTSLVPGPAPSQIVRSIFVEGGNVVGAISNAPAESLPAIVFEVGALERHQITAIEQRARGEKRRFDEVASESGALSHARLFELVAMQAEEIVYSALQLPAGWFWFLDHGERLRDEPRLLHRYPVSANDLLMEGVRRLDELRFFRERIPSDQHVPVPLASRGEPPTDLAPTLAACDGRRTVLEVGRACGLSQFEVTHALYQLVRAGFLRVDDPRPETAQAVVDSFNETMRGVLSACDAAGKGAIVRDHLEKFALTGLFEELFRGAGPRRDGTVEPDRVAHNVERLRCEEPLSVLAESLHDYVEFALFSAESHLPRESYREVAAKARALASALGPRGPRPADSPSRRPPAMREGEASRPRSHRTASRSTPPSEPSFGVPPSNESGRAVSLGVEALAGPTRSSDGSDGRDGLEPGEAKVPSRPPETLPPPRPSMQAIRPPAAPQLDLEPTAPHEEQSSLDGLATAVGDPFASVLAREEAALEPVAPSSGVSTSAPMVEESSLHPPRMPSARPTAPARSDARKSLAIAAVALLGVAGIGVASMRWKADRGVRDANASNPPSDVAPGAGSQAPTPLPMRTTAASSTALRGESEAHAAPSIAPTVEAAAPSAAATASAAHVEAETSEPARAGEGRLITPASARGRRVFVDGRVIGEGGKPLTVACGVHVVKVGSSGTPRTINVPCGGEVDALAGAANAGSPTPPTGKAPAEPSPYE